MALTEEQLELLGDELVPIFQRLEREVINDIARRVAKTGRLTETAEIQAEALQRLGFSPAEIRMKVMRMLNADPDLQKEIAVQTLAYKKALQEQIDQTMDLIDEQAAKTWEEAGNLAFHNDLSVWQGERLPVKGSAFDSLIKAMRASTKDLKNLTKTIAFHGATGENIRIKQAYTNAMNNALTKVASGAFSFDRACDDVVRDLARSGLRTVDYDSGRSMQIDTAARLQVQTASTQLAGQVTMQNCETAGQNYVEVSYHIGARNKGEGHRNHASWQGKVYCLEGSDGVYENLEQATGYPSDPTGLCGYNCRHTFYPFWPGLSVPAEKPPEPQPKTWNGVTYDYYDATQEQRRREREIRALKRQASAEEAAGLTEEAKTTKSLLKQKSAEYREFSEAMDISAKPNRLRVVDQTNELPYNVGSGYMDMIASTVNGSKKFKDACIKAKEESGFRGELKIPKYSTKILDYYFDDAHINGERGHNVTREEAIGFIKNSFVRVKRWNGKCDCYFGDNGCAYVNHELKTISTSYLRQEYDAVTRKMYEVLKDGVSI